MKVLRRKNLTFYWEARWGDVNLELSGGQLERKTEPEMEKNQVLMTAFELPDPAVPEAHVSLHKHYFS